jgi:thiol-disulfide isomerase/thioredoxin
LSTLNHDNEEVRTWTFMDRAKWPNGEWDNEPDKVEWRDDATGYPCIARRGLSGSWCGYVAVPPGHELHGKDYNDVDVIVHGGLTYADVCAEDIERGVCHKPLDGESDDVWWFGFDCAHCFDFMPALAWVQDEVRADAIRRGDKLLAEYEPDETYRNLEYVKYECTLLAAQLSNYPEGFNA